MSMQVGLIGTGGRAWRTGVQGHHSLLFGNSRLPADERLEFRVYLDESLQRTTDYRSVSQFARAVHSTDFSSSQPPALWRRLRKVARIILHQHRWPAWPQSSLPELLLRHRPEIVFTVNHLTSVPSDARQVCWMTDFQHRHQPELFTPEQVRRRDRALGRILARADRVVVGNRSTLEDAVRLAPGACDRLTVLPFASFLGHEWRRPDPAETVRRHRLPEKFLLCPGTFWRHKGHALLFRAVHRLRQRGRRDVVVACTGHPEDPRCATHGNRLRNQLREHRLEEAVRILGPVPRTEEVQLMRAAAAIVQPASFEAWSPVLADARSLGKPVIASRIPAHEEQRTDRTTFFDPESVEALADVLAGLWPELLPGAAGDEAAAAADYEERITAFARAFVDVCRAAVGEASPLVETTAAREAAGRV